MTDKYSWIKFIVLNITTRKMTTNILLAQLFNCAKKIDPCLGESIELKYNSILIKGKSVSVFLDDENTSFFGISIDEKRVFYDESVIREPEIVQYFSVRTPQDAIDVLLEKCA